MWRPQLSAFVGPLSLVRRLSTRAIPNRRALCMEATPNGEVPAPVRSRILPPALRPVVPARELLPFVEDKAHRRSDVVRALGDYVRQHNLQDPNNRSIVHCDHALGSLLGVNKCTMLELSKYVNPHLVKPVVAGGRYLVEARALEEAYYESVKDQPVKPPRKRKNVGAKRESGGGLFKPVRLSPQLAALCDGKTVMARQDIIKAVWAYVKRYNLKGPPGTPILCDPPMERVFGTKELSVQGVMKGISAHVTKID